MYKIYINETPLILISSKDFKKQIYPRDHVLAFVYLGKKKALLNYIDNLEKSNNYKAIVVHYEDVEKLFNDFMSLFKIVKAAGGLVTNKKEQILFIYRRGFWDLPKGKLDNGEDYKMAAVREVKEECGLKNLTRGAKLTTTYHVFKNLSKQRILKKTKWYHMTSSDTKLVAQKEEDIEIAKWRKLGEFLASGDVAYNNINDVLFTYFDKT
ncbi:NUDIX hydrolase [Portibacter marinus]|uniref:NUDIX hydrolase n=1 Tax=Portibacter marinus TaxID=2898660 RepID=UPI001F30C237|nr:NUDIX domain-containing protein [Portibacter marinus]